MAAATKAGLTRASFALPGERSWGAAEHSDGVCFAESAAERVGPFPAETAHREAVRRNEYELVIALAEAMLAPNGVSELERLASKPRFAIAFDPLLAAALTVLYERGEYDEAVETEDGPVALVDRFLVSIELAAVLVREYDTPREAEHSFGVFREES